MAARLNMTCDKSRDHAPPHGKALAEAAFYPMKLRIAILRGMRDQADHKDRMVHEDDMDINLESLRAYQSSNAVARTASSIVAGVHKGKDHHPIVARLKF